MIWTEADYEKFSWHDNHVHGISICEGEHGTGELILDLDYMLNGSRTEKDSISKLHRLY